MTNRRLSSRHGFSLIEMVLIIGAVSIIIGLCATVLSGLFRIERSGRASMADATTLARFARQFRQDARGSTAVKRAEGKAGAATFEMSGPEGASVVYRVEKGQLVREERRGDRAVRGESFAAERLGPVSFGVEGRRVWAVLSRKSGRQTAPAKPEARIEARLGKDQEIAALPKGKK